MRILLVFLLLAACAAPLPHETFTLQSMSPAAAKRLPLVLELTTPKARPGFEGERMAYVRRPFELEYFAKNRWIAPPAEMLSPLLREALENRFAAVTTSALARADLRLDTEILLFQQEFADGQSRSHLRVKAELHDLRRGTTSEREFDEIVPATADPYGGVVAMNQAVRNFLDKIAGFCAGS